jgi:hypothetical protein
MRMKVELEELVLLNLLADLMNIVENVPSSGI